MERYGSRKFVVTLSAMASTVLLAYFGKMSGDVALVLAACVAAYNWANARVANVS